MGYRRRKAAGGGSLWLKAASLIIAAAMLPACGYRFQGRIRLPDNAQHIHIETFQNRTNLELLEALVTNAIVVEFTKRSENIIVEELSQADLVMKGVIQSLESQTISSRRKDAAGERRVTLRLDVQLVRADGRVIWEAKGLTDNDAYSVTDDKFQNDFRERRTAAAVATRIAERIFNRFSDDF